MKFILALVICSQVQQTCLPPYQWPDTFDSQYDCLMFGYEESMKKMEEIGRTEINKHGMFVNFFSADLFHFFHRFFVAKHQAIVLAVKCLWPFISR